MARDADDGAIGPDACAQGVGEIMNQVISQAGPALDLARQTLGSARNGNAPEVEVAPPDH